MAIPQEVKDRARSLYINNRMTLHEVADAVGVSYSTIRAWRRASGDKADDWDTARATASLVASGMTQVAGQFLENFLRVYGHTVKALNKQIDDADDPEQQAEFDPHKAADSLAKMADAFVKTTRAVSNSEPKLGRLAIAQEVIEKLTDYIKDEHPEQLQGWVNLLEGFSRFVAEAFAAQ